MRFTIRDVLWLTVVVALAVGWWIEHRRAAGRFRASAGLRPPTDLEVIGEWESKNGNKAAGLILAEYKQGNVTILKQKTATYTDRPANGTQVEHVHFRCRIECPTAQIADSVFVDRTLVRQLSE